MFVSRILFAFALVVCVGMCGATTPTVSSLNVTKYVGRWFQMYGDPLVFATFEKDAYCATADYAIESASPPTISVLNREHYKSVTGPIHSIVGKGIQKDPSKPGQLTVTFSSVPLPAPYWIMELGPDTFGPDGQYQYALVSDQFKASLFVLARDVATFRAKYEAGVLSALGNLGFHGLNKPIALPQDNCTYPPPPQ